MVSAVLSNTQGYENMCMVALLKIVDAVFYFGLFMKEYLQTDDEWKLSFAILKVVQLI